MAANHIPHEVDVLIIGGGPVGLLLAYQLARLGSVSIHVVEKNPKPAQDNFGRAVTFWSRSMEMLEQVGLGHKIAQQCFSVRTSVGYDANGVEVQGRGWSFVEDIQDTKWNFATVCRQKYIEEIYRGELDKLGFHVHAPAEFKDLEIDESIPPGDHRVTATISDATASKDVKIKCRYLIGADGSHSGRAGVRHAASIPSDGDSTEDRWVRIDGMLTTDMPKSRSYGAIESPVYGNVLWIPLDHGATRIGYHLTDARWKHYGGVFNQALAVSEAQEAVKPFNITYSRVDWASIYFVGQRVAEQFFTKGCVFLAGDACHTHSSGAGQGMNAGTHDAINLAWKLSLVLRGIASPELLETYEHERRPNAQKLINYDKDISVLISKRLPKSWIGDPDADPNVVLGQILQEAKGFNTGLTIGYERNILNVSPTEPGAEGKECSSLTPIYTSPTPATPGYRGPDAPLLTPATLETTRIHALTPNTARFHILLFTGDPIRTRPRLAAFMATAARSPVLSPGCNRASAPYLTASTVAGDTATTNGHHTPPSEPHRQRDKQPLPISYMTILATQGPSVWELMGGTSALGDAYFDPPSASSVENTCPAHARYGVDMDEGAVVVVRPDGWIGMRVSVDEGAVAEVQGYFGGFLVGVGDGFGVGGGGLGVDGEGEGEGEVDGGGVWEEKELLVVQ